MERHSPAAAKRLRNFLRVAFLMMQKGLISKRKLVMDMNLMMKRGKVMGKNLGNLVFHPHNHHHHHRRPSRGYGFSLQEYEFSCTTTPNPVFFHAKRRHNYFPCLTSVVEGDETPRPTTFSVPRIEYYPSPCSGGLSQELASGENKSPLILSPISVGVSNYSSELEAEAGVDSEAEDFIRRFYEQLRVQSRIALIEYQELEYQDMLERGC